MSTDLHLDTPGYWTGGLRWSITYGGDEPIDHPFYEPLLDALCASSKDDQRQFGIVCDFTTEDDRGVTQLTHGIPVDYDREHGDLHVRLFDEETQEPEDQTTVVPVSDIVQIHIC